ncbi:hypothetical protein [Anaerovibrio slackiae]
MKVICAVKTAAPHSTPLTPRASPAPAIEQLKPMAGTRLTT